MADVALRPIGINTGTATPATPSSITSQAGNLLLVLVAVIGTSPTIATPTSAGTWTQIQKVQGASLSFAMYMQANTAGGAINPSSVLGGTVTGWVSWILEFTATGANCGLQGSASQSSAVAQLTNIFPSSGQTLPNALYVYAVARAVASITAANTSFGVLSVWSPTIFAMTNNGISLDGYWLSTLGQGASQPPAASGLLSAAVASVSIGAWFNTIASQPSAQDTIGGNSGVLVGGQFQGMIGG